MKRRAVYFAAENEVELVEETVDPIEKGEVLVRSIVSAVSAGTELLFLRGQVPRTMTVDESIADLGRGSVRYPLKYGYATVGRIAQLGQDVEPGMMGRLVFAFHPHESSFVTTPDALIELPEDMQPEKAALLPTMETAVALVMDAQPVLGEQLVVVGLGVVGLFVVQLLASMSPGRLVGVDGLAPRRERALQLGADAVMDTADRNVVDSIRELLCQSPGGEEYRGADLAFELSGNPAGLDVAIRSVGFDGRVLIGSWYGTKPAPLESLGEAFHRNHVRLLSSQVSRLNPRWTGRWTKSRRLQTALDRLAKLDHETFITHRFPVEQARDAYELLCSHPEDALQVLLTYEEP
jgi:alcohol dehydrogenase